MAERKPTNKPHRRVPPGSAAGSLPPTNHPLVVRDRRGWPGLLTLYVLYGNAGCDPMPTDDYQLPAPPLGDVRPGHRKPDISD